MSDPSKNFGEDAGRYATYRPDYPQDVFDLLISHVRSGKKLAVDLGAGSCQATRKLVRLFDYVVAVEPDARQAAEAQISENAEIRIASAEDVTFEAKSIDAVVSATAFHWMNQPLICRKVASWLKPDGVFFPFAFDRFEIEGEVGEFYNTEFEKWKEYRDRRIVECYDYTGALTNSREFEKVIPFAQNFSHTLPSEAAAGIVSTFSFARAYAKSTNNAERYFQEVTDVFVKAGETVTIKTPIVGALGVKS
ncbi:class I SAM-dependent methyltransferase [Hyphococcus flavus]|uniref:Class I SAM-dependent methyltransferase n=1 Tax=Hyphococcus flavus TaxID=1866326 RepID=A0AAE9ZAW8_9PROT|nr:class I SAM-dependent methyltransferase [Hyphococcus flavus]WDI30511.1 class I SAM-dependent methyltransferase [Hyphococcus flavus]